MNLAYLLFGRPPIVKGRRLKTPPPGVEWRTVKWRDRNPPVRAKLATRNGRLKSARGELNYRKGEHYIIDKDASDQSVVRRDIFELRPDGAYEKRNDLSYRYFTLSEPTTILTLEGPQRAEAGDWIMQGLAGELWPIASEEAEAKYVAA